MPKHSIIASIIATALLVSACDEIPTPTDPSAARSVTTVDMEKGPWSSFSGHWNQKSDDYELRYTVRNMGGKAAVCGVQFDGTRNIRNLQNRLMRDFGLYVNATLIVQGFDHFTKVDDVRVRGLQGVCKVGKADWSNEFSDNDNWDVRRRGDGSYRL